MPKPFIPTIGLAGGIGSGKSHVANILASAGCEVSNADNQIRAALARPAVARRLAALLGPSILNPSTRRIDRDRLAALIFSNPAARRKAEAYLHPLIEADRHRAWNSIRHRTPAARLPKAFVIDAPLLFEAKLHKECDAVIFIYVPQALRLERLRATRNWTAAELRRRQAAQLPLNLKRKMSDYVIVNTGDPAMLRSHVLSVLARILQKTT